MAYEERLLDTDTCVIAFTALDAPGFEWGGVLERRGVAHILVRDQGEKWYCEGIPGIGNQCQSIAYIRRLSKRYKKVLTLGSSAGAHGALRYGNLAADGVIAISPITDIAEYLEWRPRGVPVPHDHDLAPYFIGGPIAQVKAFVTDGEHTIYDRPHTERLGITDITLIPGSSHSDLAHLMRDTGWFDRLIN